MKKEFLQSNLPYRKPINIILQVCCKLVSFLSSITITAKSPHRNCAINEILRKSIRLKGLNSCVGYFLRSSEAEQRDYESTITFHSQKAFVG